MLTVLLWVILAPIALSFLIYLGPLLLALLFRLLSGFGGVVVMFIILLLMAGK